MKNYLTLLSFFWVLPMWAQQSEPLVPSILPAEAAQFLRDFEKTVSYLADKRVDSMTRVNQAIAFSGRFASKAVIQIMNSNKKAISLSPLEYFQRVIALNYEEVSIGFEVVKHEPFAQKPDHWWNKRYILKQTFKGKRGGKVVAADYTIKSIDLYYFYDTVSKTWTKKYGHVLALDQQNLLRR
jgi:hypothetical protein